jgi:hypothetical protein
MITIIAALAIVAFVIVLLAFFFRADSQSSRFIMIGVPHEDQITNIALARYGNPERLDDTARTQDKQPPAVGESRLPKAGVPE